MKKTFLFGIVAAMLATACTEEESFNQIASGEGITFTSSVASRATDNSFEIGDEIGISMYANGAFASSATNVKYTTVDGTTFTGADITWEAAGGASLADFIGVYPYKDGSISSTTYSFTISNEDGATLSGNDVMYACSSGITTGTNNVSLAFKHKLVKVVMNVKKQDGTAITDATVTIDKQQLAGTMDLLNEGTITVTPGGTEQTITFVYNSEDSQYEAIVMPSEVVAGRAITITSDGKTYSCPVGDLAFASGTKMTLSATIIEGTGAGDVIIIEPQVISIKDWTGGVSEDYVFDADAEINVTGKTSYTLATNKTLSDTPITINEFEATLNADDAYCLSYTINDAASASAISRTDGEYSIMVAPIEGDGEPKEYILPKNQISGQLLIAVEENTTGIKVSGTEGITLNEVLVYTSQNIVVPIELWSTDAPTAGNGISNTNAWPNDILNFTVPENVRSVLTPGATLNIYYNSYSTINFNYYNPETGLYGTDGPSLSSGATDNTEGKYLSLTVLSPLIKAIKTNDYVVGLTGSGNEITRIVLVPTETPLSENIVWMGESVNMWGDYATVSLPLQGDDIAVGSIFRVTFRSSDETNQTAPEGKISFGTTVWNNDTQKTDVTVLSDLSDLKVTIPDPSKPNEGYVEVAVTDEMYNAFQSNNILGGGTPLAIMGGSTESNFSGNIILQVEILPAGTAE